MNIDCECAMSYSFEIPRIILQAQIWAIFARVPSDLAVLAGKIQLSVVFSHIAVLSLG